MVGPDADAGGLGEGPRIICGRGSMMQPSNYARTKMLYLACDELPRGRPIFVSHARQHVPRLSLRFKLMDVSAEDPSPLVAGERGPGAHKQGWRGGCRRGCTRVLANGSGRDVAWCSNMLPSRRMIAALQHSLAGSVCHSLLL